MLTKSCVPWTSILLVIVLLASAVPAQTCTPGIEYVQEYRWEPAGPVSICLAPDRAARVFLAGGVETQAVLSFPVAIMAGWPEPETVPVEWWSSGPEVLCGGTTESVVRDQDGRVSLLPAMRGGGHRGPDETGAISLWIPVCPNQMLEIEEGVCFNSPDINGDLAVNLSDVALFAADYHGAYDYRSDFIWDGALNLSDLVVLSRDLGGVCP